MQVKAYRTVPSCTGERGAWNGYLHRVHRAAWLVVTLFATACSDKTEGGLSLREHVSLRCSQLTREIAHAADQYEEMARHLRAGNVADEGLRRRADGGLPFGFTFYVRMAHSRHLNESMSFCTYSKKGYEPLLDNLSTRASIAIDEFSRAGKFLAEPPEENVDIMARAMRELATTAYILNTMPVKD
jgi:hypothetical protein